MNIWNSLLDFTKRRILIEIKTQEFVPSSRWSCLTYLTKGGPIVYDMNTFKMLNNNTEHHTRYKVLTFGAISRICKLKLNRQSENY